MDPMATEQRIERIKMSWPEVVGWYVLPAINMIHADRPDLKIEVHHLNGGRVPLGHDYKRVRVFTITGEHGEIVDRMPVVG